MEKTGYMDEYTNENRWKNSRSEALI